MIAMKILRGIAINFLLAICIFAASRFFFNTPHQGMIDNAVLILCSSAHFLYMRNASIKEKLLTLAISLIVNSFGMLTYVTAVLRDSI